MRTCPGHRFDSGLLADPCISCARRGPGNLIPLAQFVERQDWVGWACLNWARKEVNDRPEPPTRPIRDEVAGPADMAR